MIIDVAPERVFHVLSEPSHYAVFVVGSRKVRYVEGTWPGVGARFHHSLGAGLTLIRDATTVIEVDDQRRLLLHTAMGPLGANHTEFRVREHPRGCRVELEERPAEGLIAVPGLGWIVTGLLWVRNHEVLRRLRTVVKAAAGSR